MGQAKQRGNLEQRRIVAVERDAEVKRLDEWFRARQPKKKINYELSILMAVMAGLSVT